MSRKIIGITVGTPLPKPNFNQDDPTKGDYIKNRPDFEGLQAEVNAKVPTERTINGKPLTDNVVLTASDIGADVSGSAGAVLEEAKTYIDTALTQKAQVQIITWEADD